MYRSYDHIALILAALLKESGRTRLRISDKTFRMASGRPTAIRRALVEGVEGWLADYGVMMIELDRGGYALIATSALEGAPSTTLKRTLANWKQLTPEELIARLELDEVQGEE